ncbi:type I DNA topoisomerase [Acanthopleuribacter pedis]|uniref:DNA topoisomerase 1 n=1 Tax=Acanthopleuribacter pedis TaxID=442870 RepID=A0A8J7QGF1_9BACT|nr:type I DNA topoisomerase [Acanthopleuribacter pedis]MBO1318173.1 type I DNA topoisomerase [Acanthopleuribacter pedis]
MAKSLVIVESPAKAKTINKYLGKDFKVLASMGHIRDLPTNKLGVDLEHDFEPDYTAMASKRKIISELKSEAKKAESVYLAPDPDREGEAICWHLQQGVIPEGKQVFRVMFNEITKKAVQAAIDNPGAVNMHLVDAQQARRILDRLVGYLISPVLWKKVKRGISAGRVQSVALRMIVDREYEILAFDPVEFWTFVGLFEGSSKPEFKAKLVKWQGETLKQGNKDAKRNIANAEQADEIEKALKAAQFAISSVKRKAKKQNPPPPFTTSKLQQEASRALGFTVKKTMMLAQKLYEGIEIDGDPVGLITYMRTDSMRVSEEAINQVREYIGEQFDDTYLPAEARRVKQKKNIQDGHEAIRPTHVEFSPEYLAKRLEKDEARLYTLIWKRFVASQMAAKEMDETVLEITAADGLFEAKGLVTTFAGFTTLYTEAGSEKSESGNDLPKLEEGEILKVNELEKKQNHTKPPSRYTEASLVKALEENGIGRPSTYAAIIATIQNRDYVEKREGRFLPSDLGVVVTSLLTTSFPDLMDTHYTARMEGRLDEVEHGSLTWKHLLSDFYGGFAERLKEAEEKMPNIKRDGLETDLKCDECGNPMVIKTGRYGQFLSCSNYPTCTAAKRIKDLSPDDTEMPMLKGMIGKVNEAPEALNKPCPDCGHDLVRRNGRYGEFIACSNYPDCRYIHKELVGVKCPKGKCDGDVQVRKSKKGKVFYGCTKYPKCDFVSWDKPTGEKCPNCPAPTLYEKVRKKETTHYCNNSECKFSKVIEPEEAAATV